MTSFSVPRALTARDLVAAAAAGVAAGFLTFYVATIFLPRVRIPAAPPVRVPEDAA